MARPIVPVTQAMLTPANQHAAKPRYDTPADWSVGAEGNDVDIATRTEAVVGSSSAATVTPYPIRTQTAKAAAMVPPLEVLGDLGKDYGVYSGQTGRTGWIEPGAPYAPEPVEP